MNTIPAIAADDIILQKIFLVRNHKVMLDKDLARLYNVPTKVLNQAVKRHLSRFPADFMFRLTKEELQNWKSQNVTSNSIKLGMRKLPLAFTEPGIAMLSSVLNSERAIEVNIRIIRLFIRMRDVLQSSEEMMHKILELENQVGRNNGDITTIFTILKQLIQTPPAPRIRIGFKVKPDEL